MREQQCGLEKLRAEGITELKKQNRKKHGDNRAQYDKAEIIKDGVSGNDPCIIGNEQKAEIFHAVPGAAPDALGEGIVLECKEQAGHRQVIVDKEVENAGQGDQPQRHCIAPPQATSGPGFADLHGIASFGHGYNWIREAEETLRPLEKRCTGSIT